MAGVWIWAESRNHTMELLNIGGELANRLGTRLVAFLNNPEWAADYMAAGADEVLILPVLGPGQPWEAYVPVIADAALAEEPDVFLIGATLRGNEIAARLASRLNTGLVSECTSVTYHEEEKRLEMKRLAFGGAAEQSVVCLTRPQMATISFGVFEPALLKEGRKGTIRELPAPMPSAVTVIEKRPVPTQTQDITEARVVICVGRGLEKEEDLELARKLAAITGGEIACTRPLSAELKWLPEEVCIGLSGKQVRPDLYIGIGISGQIQHVTGIKEARIICAINRDEKAPLFDMADYGVAGDLYQILPLLINEIERISGK